MCTRRQAGLTMIELIIFIVIISVAVAGVLSVLTYTTSRSADPLQRKQAILIAEGLLEEVSLARMTFCPADDPNVETATSAADCATPETVGPGASTRPYPHVNDYVSAFGVPTSFTPGDSTGLIRDALGNPLMNSASGSYRAFVTITAAGALGPAGATAINGSGSADTDLLLVSVSVQYGNEKIVLERFRTRYAPNSPP